MSRSRASRAKTLKPFLESLYCRLHRSEFIGFDPLGAVRRFDDHFDREIAAFFAALLAYGNVRQIDRSLRDLFQRMGGRPGKFVRDFQYTRAERLMRGFKHRFTDSEDILCLCYLLHQACGRNSLQDVFVLGFDATEPDLVDAASRFVDRLHSMNFEPNFDRDRMLHKGSFKHLLPRADKGSACKRIHLFLRWMIRPADGLDLGIWRTISPDKLLIPVDTHVLRIAQNLGLVKRNTASLNTAREITESLRAADPSDPVRFDFAICRLGILKECPSKRNAENCAKCELSPVCVKKA